MTQGLLPCDRLNTNLDLPTTTDSHPLTPAMGKWTTKLGQWVTVPTGTQLLNPRNTKNLKGWMRQGT